MAGKITGLKAYLYSLRHRWQAKLNKKVLLMITAAIGIPLFYFADVFILGSLAAAVHDLNWSLKTVSIVATPGELAAGHGRMLGYIAAHPLQTGWSWLGFTRQAAVLEVRTTWLWLHPILGVLGLFIYFRSRKGRRKNTARLSHGQTIADNPAHGTSRWAGPKDIQSLCAFGPPKAGAVNPGGILIGELTGRIARVIPGKSPPGMPSLAGHAAVFGGTGSGKTYSFVMPNIICAVADGQSFILTDPKSELLETTANWLLSKGYEVKIFNLSNPAHSHRWNPILESADDAEIAEMASCFIMNAGKDDNGYFVAKETQLLEALAGLLKGDFPVRQQHMRSIMSLASWSQEQLDARFREAFSAGKITPTTYERWRGASAANFEHAVSGLTAKLKTLTTEPLSALLSEQEIALGQIGTRKTALFCILPIRGENKILRPILSTFYMFLFRRLYELAAAGGNRRLAIPVRFLLDEMPNVGQIPGFSEIISTARSLGIQIQFILQGRSQLDDVYSREEAKNILANCPTLLLLGVAPGDLETAKMFTEILGKAAVRGQFEKKDLTIPLPKNLKYAQKTEQILERPLMTSDEIARMDPGDCIASIQWCYPAYLRKVGWPQLPQAAQIKELGELPVSALVPAKPYAVELPGLAREKTAAMDLTKNQANSSNKQANANPVQINIWR